MAWSALIPDMLKLISDRLHHCFDYINIRMVCTHWRSSVPPKKFTPLLILPPEPDFGDLRFFDPADGSVHSLPLPEEARNKSFCGTSRGWLALMDDATQSMLLVNPFTSVRYPLPPTPQRVYFTSHPKGPASGRWITQHECINEIVTSASPNAGAECVVMARLGSCDQLVFCRLGDAVWTDVDTHYEIDGVAFCDSRFYALDRDGGILIIELGPDGSVALEQTVVVPFESEQYKFLEWNGELLVVGISFQPIYEDDDDDDDLGPFIFKSEGLREGLTLSEMESLGKNTLFVSENHCFGYVGREVHGCKRNCIYLSGTAYDGLEGVHHITIMDLEDGTSEIVSCRWPSQRSGLPRERSQFSGAFFWFRPSFY
ncbi:F-box protein SKIP23-like [Cocos nucifera]|uniref:F-box protein SKIP23-like n=1 Tax=Cocos nucifera TaxID=13894 RepID=A0A8K0IKI9_COCNU|nr:F-box protein SKIP23-like [Cocos nucifera]